MEIREYLKAKRRWLPALVLVPMLAGAATVGYVALQPPEVTAEVRAYVPPALTSSDSQIGLYVARLDETLKLRGARTEIAAIAQVRPNQLEAVTAERTGQSDQFTLTVVTTAPEERAVAVAEAAAKWGTSQVARQTLQGADVTTELARQNFDKAQTDLFAYQDEIRDLDPNVTYANVSRQVLDPGPDTDVAALRSQQEELVAQVRRYNELRSVVQTTSSSLGQAQSQSNARGAEIIAAESGSQILFTEVVDEPIPGMRYLEHAGLSIVLAFIAVLGLSLLPDLLRRRPTSPEPAAPGTDGTPVPPTTATGFGPTGPEPRLTPHGNRAPGTNGAHAARASGPTGGAGR